MVVIFVMQVVFLTFAGKAIRVVQWGLDPVQWLLTIAFGALGLIWGLVLKFIPAEHWIKFGAGSKPMSVEDLNKLNTLTIKRNHDSGFY